jgi:hypothetical protein
MSSRADVAQSVEHSLGKGEVTGSIPVISSRFFEVVFRPAMRVLGTDSSLALYCVGGSNSVVESQPSKLLVAGSIPVSRSKSESREVWASD